MHNTSSTQASDSARLRPEILDKVKTFHEATQQGKTAFRPGEDQVHYAGRVHDADELMTLVDASLDFWLTAGRFTEEFESGLAEFLGLENCLTVNSGSSANLVAFSTLTSPKLGERRIKPGDEVITVAAGFPTTVNPIIQYGAVPVFVDVELGSYVPALATIEAAIGPNTKAVMMAHTMGVPFELRELREALRPAQLVAGRGQLRRAGQPLRRSVYRHLRPPRHRKLLPGPPHHDGGGRCGAD